MSRVDVIVCLPFLASFAMPALGEEPSLQEAALNAAVSAKCRAQLGDEQLFEVAFGMLREVASEKAGGPSEAQLGDYQRQLLTSTPSEPEPMIAEMCGALRAFLIPE